MKLGMLASAGAVGVGKRCVCVGGGGGGEGGPGERIMVGGGGGGERSGRENYGVRTVCYLWLARRWVRFRVWGWVQGQ